MTDANAVAPRVSHLRVAVAIALAAAASVPLLMPYLFALIPDLASRVAGMGVPLFVVLQTLQAALVLLALAWIGLRLGFAYGLDAPRLRRWLGAGPADSRQANWLFAAGLGVGVAVICIVLDRLLQAFDLSGPIAQPEAWKGLLAAFYGGINEEVTCRLFLVSVFVWVAARVLRAPTPRAGAYWCAIVLAAVLFGAGHLPALAQIAPLTAFAVLRTVGLNAIAGTAFGWLFWRHGLEHAVLAHFSADIVLHAIAPLLAPT